MSISFEIPNFKVDSSGDSNLDPTDDSLLRANSFNRRSRAKRDEEDELPSDITEATNDETPYSRRKSYSRSGSSSLMKVKSTEMPSNFQSRVSFDTVDIDYIDPSDEEGGYDFDDEDDFLYRVASNERSLSPQGRRSSSPYASPRSLSPAMPPLPSVPPSPEEMDRFMRTITRRDYPTQPIVTHDACTLTVMHKDFDQHSVTHHSATGDKLTHHDHTYYIHSDYASPNEKSFFNEGTDTPQSIISRGRCNKPKNAEVSEEKPANATEQEQPEEKEAQTEPADQQKEKRHPIHTYTPLSRIFMVYISGRKHTWTALDYVATKLLRDGDMVVIVAAVSPGDIAPRRLSLDYYAPNSRRSSRSFHRSLSRDPKSRSRSISVGRSVSRARDMYEMRKNERAGRVRKTAKDVVDYMLHLLDSALRVAITVEIGVGTTHQILRDTYKLYLPSLIVIGCKNEGSIMRRTRRSLLLSDRLLMKSPVPVIVVPSDNMNKFEKALFPHLYGHEKKKKNKKDAEDVDDDKATAKRLGIFSNSAVPRIMRSTTAGGVALTGEGTDDDSVSPTRSLDKRRDSDTLSPTQSLVSGEESVSEKDEVPEMVNFRRSSTKDDPSFRSPTTVSSPISRTTSRTDTQSIRSLESFEFAGSDGIPRIDIRQYVDPTFYKTRCAKICADSILTGQKILDETPVYRVSSLLDALPPTDSGSQSSTPSRRSMLDVEPVGPVRGSSGLKKVLSASEIPSRGKSQSSGIDSLLARQHEADSVRRAHELRKLDSLTVSKEKPLMSRHKSHSGVISESSKSDKEKDRKEEKSKKKGEESSSRPFWKRHGSRVGSFFSKK